MSNQDFYGEEKMKRKTFLEKIGFCKHFWKRISLETTPYRVVYVCQCERCGRIKGFRIW